MTVVVEHGDRLGRVSAELVEAALSAGGRELAVLSDGELEGDLVRDMAAVLTSFCARLYGRSWARNRALKALGARIRTRGCQAGESEEAQNAGCRVRGRAAGRFPHPDPRQSIGI